MVQGEGRVRIGALVILGALGMMGCGRVPTENLGATSAAAADEAVDPAMQELAQPTYQVYTEGQESSTRVHVVRVPAGAGWQVVPGEARSESNRRSARVATLRPRVRHRRVPVP